MQLPQTQHAIQIVGPDQIIVNPAKPVDQIGPYQLLLQVEACGICFSDTKLLHAFDAHPRKAPVVAGLAAAELAEIPSYRPGGAPTVPGHEPVARVVAVGAEVTHYAVGDRVLVQADWKHLPTEASNGAFGYNFEGALQEYVVIDERCVVTPQGERFLLPVAEGPAAAAIGLIEPWATVEGAYSGVERTAPLVGGRLLLVADPGTVPTVDALLAAARPAELVVVGEVDLSAGTPVRRVGAVADLAGESFDDICYFGSDAATLGELGGLLGTRAILNTVLGGARLDGPVLVDIGRVHYDLIRYAGTTGSDPLDGYRWLPGSAAVRAGERMAIVGAAGPMGLMHTVRAVTLGVPGISIDATDLSDDRLAHLAEVVAPLADAQGIPMRYLNTGEQPLASGYSYIVCMVPVPALVAQAVSRCTSGGIVNAFAGIPAGTRAELDLQHLIAEQVFLMGSSGSSTADMATVLAKIEDGTIDTLVSLDAVCGMAGFTDAIEAVMERRSGGKIMVYPALPDLGLVRLADLPSVLPAVAAAMVDGLWTAEAERLLLATAGARQP